MSREACAIASRSSMRMVRKRSRAARSPGRVRRAARVPRAVPVQTTSCTVMIERTASRRARRSGPGNGPPPGGARRSGGQLRMLVQLRRETAAAASARVRTPAAPAGCSAAARRRARRSCRADPARPRRRGPRRALRRRSRCRARRAPEAALQATRVEPDGALSGPAAERLLLDRSLTRCGFSRPPAIGQAIARPAVCRSAPRPLQISRRERRELRRPKRLRHSLRCANRHTAPPAGGLPARRR